MQQYQQQDDKNEGILPIQGHLLHSSIKDPSKTKKTKNSWITKKKRHNTTKLLYNWNMVENKRYLKFLIKKRKLFNLSSYEKKCIKINCLMAEEIKTRNAAQCHTHHQKMVMKYGSIDNILIELSHLTRPKQRSIKTTIINSEAKNNQLPNGLQQDEQQRKQNIERWLNMKQRFLFESYGVPSESNHFSWSS